ncbi:MAG: type II toxin-antitoxin system RelE/ParE family toxin [Treponema sp.]|nr:type II toxin-antitoxin system RelE/ParE family toxin [Treponema sp.]
MRVIHTAAEFDTWFSKLKDDRATARITIRIRRLALGNPGDVKPVGNGISELRIDYGPGYRVYFKDTGKDIIILLCGGDKSTQSSDIEQAKEILRNLEV